MFRLSEVNWKCYQFVGRLINSILLECLRCWLLLHISIFNFFLYVNSGQKSFRFSNFLYWFCYFTASYWNTFWNSFTNTRNSYTLSSSYTENVLHWKLSYLNNTQSQFKLNSIDLFLLFSQIWSKTFSFSNQSHCCWHMENRCSVSALYKYTAWNECLSWKLD